MSFNSTLNDMIIRILNGQKSHKLVIELKFSKKCVEILTILRKEGYIRNFECSQQKIKVFLKYINDKPAINFIKTIASKNIKNKISKKKISQLIKTSSKNIDKNLGLYIISTTKGILSERQSFLNNIGGIILFKVI